MEKLLPGARQLLNYTSADLSETHHLAAKARRVVRTNPVLAESCLDDLLILLVRMEERLPEFEQKLQRAADGRGRETLADRLNELEGRLEQVESHLGVTRLRREGGG